MRYKNFKYNGQNPRRNTFYSVAVIIGIFLLPFHIHLYRLTVINPLYFVFIAGVVGLISSRLDLKSYRSTYSGKYLAFWAFVVNTIIWGSMSVFLFTSTNFYLTTEKIEKRTFRILEKGSIGGRKGGKPTAIIKINGGRKEIVLLRNARELLDYCDFIELSTSTGLWGFEVINKIELFKSTSINKGNHPTSKPQPQ